MNARAFAIGCLLLGAVPAQSRTWIVDQSNAPGTDFTDLPPAVAQAIDGDTVVVRTGTYTGFTTAKGLTILGEGTVRVFRLFPLPPLPTIEIQGLARGSTMVIRNVQASATSGGTPTVSLADCPGHIHFEDVHVDAQNAFTQTPPGLRVANCGQVTITGGQLDGWPAATVQGSVLTLTGVSILGGSASWSPRGATTTGVGLRSTDSLVLSSRTDIRGGSGSLLFPTASEAIVAVDTDLTLTGEATTTIAAGGGGPPTPAVDTTRGTVLVDTLLQVAGSAGAPAFQGTAQLDFRRVASLWADGAPIGGVVGVELDAPPGDPIALFAGLPGNPASAPVGILFLDAATVIPVWIGPQSIGGRSFWSFPVPQLAALRGAFVGFQAAHAEIASGTFELTNCAVVVLD